MPFDVKYETTGIISRGVFLLANKKVEQNCIQTDFLTEHCISGLKDDVRFHYSLRTYDKHSPGINGLYNDFKEEPSVHELWIEYSTLHVTIGQEVPLVDNHTFVSEIGGGLGLFLGFSMVEFVMVLYRMAMRLPWLS